jgi:hypothetical protein
LPIVALKATGKADLPSVALAKPVALKDWRSQLFEQLLPIVGIKPPAKPDALITSGYK